MDRLHLEFRRLYSDDTPIAGAQYVATLDDGTTRSGRLDAEGYARISGLPAGTSARVRYLDDPNPHRTNTVVQADSDIDDVISSADSEEQA